MSRTIIISDMHGRLAPLEAALEHARIAEGDELVLAGDLIDIGREDTVARADALGATVLVGNHEVAAALGLAITPQNPESLKRGSEFAERMLSGEWRVAYHVSGWLVTHAGVSASFLKSIGLMGTDAEEVASHLNTLFLKEIREALSRKRLDWWDIEGYRIIGGSGGPLWFRPLRTVKLPSSLRQIVGHTPPEAYDDTELESFERAGWLLIDSDGHGTGTRARVSTHRVVEPSFRYAVVDDGGATVVEG